MNALSALISQSIFFLLSTTGAFTQSAAATPPSTSPNIEVIVEADRNAAALLVFLRHIPTSGVQIYLEDLRGTHLLHETVNDRPSAAKRYQLQHLPPGTYRLRLDDEYREIYQPLKFNGRSVTILEQQRTIRHKPQIALDQRQLRVLLPNQSTAKVHIAIVDAENNVLYRERHRIQGPFRKTYALDQFHRGTYAIQIRTEGKTYAKSFTLHH
ncbi:MAG: hypothetical protein AAFW73_13905 [Bacteroidota bacterium]